MINQEKFLELYNNGVHEKEIAKELSVSTSTIRRWRLKYGLKPNNPNSNKYSFESTKDQIAKLHQEGLSDTQIADNIGCRAANVAIWRNKLKLPKNREIKEKIFLKDVKDQLIELNSQGLNDVEISKKIGCSVASICSWRNQLNLLHNDLTKYIPTIELKGFSHKAFIGHMLGDGSLAKRYDNGHARGLACHGIKQLDYLKHKREIFMDLNPTDIYDHHKTWPDGRISYCYEFRINSNTYLTDVYNKLYVNKVRCISKEYLKDYNEISLAYHFMDDGNKSGNSYTICVAGFDEESVNNLREHLFNTLGLETTYQKSKKSIYFKASTRDKFIELIKPYIIPSMEYKISNEILYEAHVKQGELLGTQETDNQQPSFASNSLEGSTTRFRVLSDKSDEYNKSDKSEDSNESTSALPVSNN